MRPYLERSGSAAGGDGRVRARRRARTKPIATRRKTRCGGSPPTRASRPCRSASKWRAALGQVRNPRFRPLLVPLMYDADLDVAREAIQSAGRLGPGNPADFLFVPPLVSLMRNRLLKARRARCWSVTASTIVDTLAYFLRDKDEDVWIRRHVPSTLALIPSQRSLDVLVDGAREHRWLRPLQGRRPPSSGSGATAPTCRSIAAVVERQILQEALRAFSALTLHHNLFVTGGLDARRRCWARRSTRSTSARSTASSACSACSTRQRTSPPCGRRCAARTRDCARARSSTSTTC